jgi:hypothetical protein
MENKKLKIKEVLREAERCGHYAISISTLDPLKRKNDLNHYTWISDFPREEIYSSIGTCVKLLTEENKPTEKEEVVVPEINDVGRKLKIGIWTHLSQSPEYYSVARGVKAMAKMMKNYGHEVVIFLQENSKLTPDDFSGCEIRKVVPHFKREKNVLNAEAKEKMKEVLGKELLGEKIDINFSFDYFISDCLTYREAIREFMDEEKPPFLFCHLARSGVGTKIKFNHYNGRYVYLNYAESGHFASQIGVDMKDVRVIFNVKDIGEIYGWDEKTKDISKKMHLWDRDIIQVYPISMDRCEAKGLKDVIHIFALLKEVGNNVCLIISDANSHKHGDKKDDNVRYAESLGLVRYEDFLLTSDIPGLERECPHKIIMDLMNIGNLFIMASRAEVSSQIMGEAAANKALMVINGDCHSLYDSVDMECAMKYPFTSEQFNPTEGGLKELAKRIAIFINGNWADRQFRRQWRENSYDAVYYNQVVPILYEDVVHK